MRPVRTLDYTMCLSTLFLWWLTIGVLVQCVLQWLLVTVHMSHANIKYINLMQFLPSISILVNN